MSGLFYLVLVLLGAGLAYIAYMTWYLLNTLEVIPFQWTSSDGIEKILKENGLPSTVWAFRIPTNWKRLKECLVINKTTVLFFIKLEIEQILILFAMNNLVEQRKAGEVSLNDTLGVVQDMLMDLPDTKDVLGGFNNIKALIYKDIKYPIFEWRRIGGIRRRKKIPFSFLVKTAPAMA